MDVVFLDTGYHFDETIGCVTRSRHMPGSDRPGHGRPPAHRRRAGRGVRPRPARQQPRPVLLPCARSIRSTGRWPGTGRGAPGCAGPTRRPGRDQGRRLGCARQGQGEPDRPVDRSRSTITSSGTASSPTPCCRRFRLGRLLPVHPPGRRRGGSARRTLGRAAASRSAASTWSGHPVNAGYPLLLDLAGRRAVVSAGVRSRPGARRGLVEAGPGRPGRRRGCARTSRPRRAGPDLAGPRLHRRRPRRRLAGAHRHRRPGTDDLVAAHAEPPGLVRARRRRDARPARLDAGGGPVRRRHRRRVRRRDPRRAVAAADAVAAGAGHRRPAAAAPAGRRPSRPGGASSAAGPGDPGLISVRGRRLLAEADVVLVDRLAPRALLDELEPERRRHRRRQDGRAPPAAAGGDQPAAGRARAGRPAGGPAQGRRPVRARPRRRGGAGLPRGRRDGRGGPGVTSACRRARCRRHPRDASRSGRSRSPSRPGTKVSTGPRWRRSRARSSC